MTDLESYQENLKLLSGYILEFKGHGNFLTREEEEVLICWLNSSPKIDLILQVVDEEVPKLYRNENNKLQPRITKIKKLVQNKIKSMAALQDIPH